MIMASWLSEFEEQARFGSAALFIEMQLRQAMAATAADNRPDSFRTACVCECLARLPEVAGSFAGVLQLLRTELLRAIYADFESLERRSRRVRLDAQGLLSCKTYFSEVTTLRAIVAEQEERLADWHRAKQDLAQDSDGRNELLRLAVARWNGVLNTVKSEMRSAAEVQETSRKLSGLLDSMLQHSKAIDELQRLSLLEPVKRLHAQVGALGNAVRRKLLVALLETYGGAALAQQEESERQELLHALLMGLDQHVRQTVVRRLAAHEGLVGAVPDMLAALVAGLGASDAASFLRAQCERHAARLADAEKRTFRQVLSRVGTADVPPPRSVSTQDGKGIHVPCDASTQTKPERDADEHADFICAVAAEVGPAATAVLVTIGVSSNPEAPDGCGRSFGGCARGGAECRLRVSPTARSLRRSSRWMTSGSAPFPARPSRSELSSHS